MAQDITATVVSKRTIDPRGGLTDLGKRLAQQYATEWKDGGQRNTDIEEQNVEMRQIFTAIRLDEDVAGRIAGGEFPNTQKAEAAKAAPRPVAKHKAVDITAPAHTRGRKSTLDGKGGLTSLGREIVQVYAKHWLQTNEREPTLEDSHKELSQVFTSIRLDTGVANRFAAGAA